MLDIITSSEAWSGVADCRNCSLRNIALFAGLNEADFEKIHTPIGQSSFAPGEALYQSDSQGSDMYTIRNGLVKLTTYLPDGTQRIVRLLRSGDVAGLEAILGNQHPHDAIALIPTEVCRLPARLVKELSSSNPILHEELMRRWQSALAQADIWLAEFSTGSARQRVARLLLRLSKNNLAEEVTLFSREDLGAVLGVTTETASRTIAEFKRQRLINEIRPNHFTCDTEKLGHLLED